MKKPMNEIDKRRMRSDWCPLDTLEASLIYSVALFWLSRGNESRPAEAVLAALDGGGLGELPGISLSEEVLYDLQLLFLAERELFDADARQEQRELLNKLRSLRGFEAVGAAH